MHTQPKNIAELTLGLKHFTAQTVHRMRSLKYDSSILMPLNTISTIAVELCHEWALFLHRTGLTFSER